MITSVINQGKETLPFFISTRIPTQ